MRTLRFLSLGALILILYPLTGCSGEKETFDYYLSDFEEDIIHPPSGTADAWVYILGGDVEGTYYVSSTGDNSNPGTREEPWATPAYGASKLSPGDTLVILPGEGGTRPTLAGNNDIFCFIDISGCKYLVIDNLEITSDNGKPCRDGINGTGEPVEHVILKNLYIHHVDEFGIDVADAQDWHVLDCRITHCGFGAIGGPAGEHGGWQNVLIDGCELSYGGHEYHKKPNGRSPYDRPDGLGIEPSVGPLEIRNTRSEHNYGDGLDSKIERTYIHECVVANNSCDGVKLWGDSSKVENTLIYGRGDGVDEPLPWASVVIESDKPNSYIELTNVTVDDSLGRNYVMYVQYDLPDVSLTLKITNCIFSARGVEAPIWLAAKVVPQMTYNLFYFPQEERVLIHGDDTYGHSDVGSLGTGNLYGDPVFTNPAWGSDGDYHLTSTSPAIDKGDSTVTLSTDLDGNPRPVGARIDIGCYER